MTIAYFVLAGQSNASKWADGPAMAGVEAFEVTFMELNPDLFGGPDPKYVDVEILNVAVSNSALLRENTPATEPDRWWYDPGSAAAGPALEGALAAIARVRAGGAGTVEFLGTLWSQGERDGSGISSQAEQALYKASLRVVLDALGNAAGSPEVYIQALGANANYNNSRGKELVREVQYELGREPAGHVHIATVTYDLPLTDGVHLTQAGYATTGERMAAYVSGGDGGPSVGVARVAGDELFLTVTSATPLDAATVSADGFTLRDGGSRVGVLSARLVDPETIALTVARPVAGTFNLHYADDDINWDLSKGDRTVIRDASGLPMAMQLLRIFAGGDAGERFVGSTHAETILGNGGADELYGRELDDTVRGGLGADLLVGGGQADTLAGEDGGDILRGGEGDDRLAGGGDADDLLGGAGRDTFAFGPGGGADLIKDFEDGRDRLSFAGFGAGYDTAGEVLAAARANGTGLVVELPDPGGTGFTTVVVDRLALADLDASDLVVAA